MKIYFSHGKESGPNGFKIKKLTEIAVKYGYIVNSIDYTDINDATIRVNHLINILKKEKDDFVLVGSSMGGYVSLVASEYVDTKALFLMAPALYIKGYEKQKYLSKTNNIEIVHGWSDNIIPPDNSIKFAKQASCPLHLIKGDHRLNSSIEIVTDIFSQFLSKIK